MEGGGSMTIFQDVKLFCNIMEEDATFDHDIMRALETVQSVLVQLGILPSTIPMVTETTLWSDWFADEVLYGTTKQYVRSKVRLIFDPPQSGTLLDQLNSLVDECEWRGFIEADTPEVI